MQTQRIKLADLSPNKGQIPGLPSNPRQWTRAEIDRIAKSLKETPELFEARPIIVTPYGGKYIILGGNLRYEGCKANKDKDAPCIIIPAETSVDKMKEIVIKDNGAFGSWDYDELANNWDDLPLVDWGVPAWETEEKPATPEVKEDDFDEDADVETRCNPGDVWQLGNHRLMCGDSTNPEDFALLMDGNMADITVTSPPYNADHLDIAASEERGGGTQKCTQKKYLADNDKRTDEEYQAFLETNVSLLLEHSKEIFYNIGVGSGSKRTIVRLLNTFIDEFKELLYWEKTNPRPVIAKGVISSSVELIIAFGKNNTRSFANFYNVMFHGVINGQSAAATNKYADIHKATFPVYLPAELISNFTKEGASVLDCFGGTGTTLIAAEQLGRRCYMMELDARYCDVIISRWETFTGKTAQLITPGDKVS